MRTITLTEYKTSEPISLSTDQRDALRQMVPSMSVTPSMGEDGLYDLTPAGTVGALRVGDLQLELASKLPLEHVLFLVSYAVDPRSWRDHRTDVGSKSQVLEALVPTFAHHVRRALRRGLLHGYRTVDETSTTVRGRIRLADQLRVRPGQHLPLELTRDDFTADILENQLLRTTIDGLLRLKLRTDATRRTLIELRSQFDAVSSVRFAPGRIPEPAWSRLNERYRPAIGLARLILRGSGLDLGHGSAEATGVLFDMADVFEDFVIVALRETLRASSRSFPQGAIGRSLRLDDEERIRLKPDLSWWAGDECVFVGDCKYKRAKVDGVPNADLYQLLAYTIALGLDDGLLVYAAGEHQAGTHTIVRAGKRLHVVTLNLGGTPDEVLGEIRSLGAHIETLARRRALLPRCDHVRA